MPELNVLLRRGGHRLWARNIEDPEGVEVWPRSDLVVTVAMNLDVCQPADCRDRFYAVLVDDGSFPILRHHPDFALPESFGEAAAAERRSYGAFMAGSFRWALRRLARFPRVLLWPEDQIRSPGQFMRDPWVLEKMPHLREWLSREPSVPPTAGALVLDLFDAADCQVLWEVAEQVEASPFNYYICDPEGAEVYQLHHHSKVVISIPDARERRRLLEELSNYPDLLEDCSGFESEDYDEYDEDEENEVDADDELSGRSESP